MQNENKPAIGVIGLGKNGYVLNARAAIAGYSSLAFSIRPANVEMTNNGHNFGDFPGAAKNLVYLTFTDMLHATTDPAAAIRRDIVFCCIDEFAEEIDAAPADAAMKLARIIGVYARRGSSFVFLMSESSGISRDKLKAEILKKSRVLIDNEITVDICKAPENSEQLDGILSDFVFLNGKGKNNE